ncbi:hypothetical protein EV179_004373 [Coemansia sp. RSA 487]|nr:hypothetical protein EV179_004373 [Coemansia sp. RSA 487]
MEEREELKADMSVADKFFHSFHYLLRRSRKLTIYVAIFLAIVTVVCLRGLLLPPNGSVLSVHTTEGVKCSDIPIPPGYWSLKASEIAAFVDIPDTRAIVVGGTVCVRVVVPSKQSNTSVSFTPLPGAPWDSVLLDLVGNATGISIPVALKEPRDNGRTGAHVYEADVMLRDSDVYRPEGYIEFRDARWNPDGPGLDPQPFTPERLAIPEDLRIQVTNGKNSLAEYMDLPLCTSADAEGRWVAVADIPFNITNMLLPPDNQNRVWMPYDCRMRTVSYPEYAQCLVDRYPVIHWFGDSNTRRALKKITSLGQWCSTPKDIASHVCICNDNSEPNDRYNSNARVMPIDMDPVSGGVAAAMDNEYLGHQVPGNKSRIVAFKWDGLTDRNRPPWSDPFDRPDGVGNALQSPTTAIFGVINWDTAFSSRAFFANEVHRLVQKVRTSYPVSMDIIIRTGQYYCCASDMDAFWKRRYSRLRNRHYDHYIVQQFREQLGDTRKISVWDVASLTERRPYKARDAEVNFCPANHARSEVINIENQILMNAMCN